MKVALVIDSVMPYRIPLYARLAELYDVDFLFTHQREVAGLDNLNYETFRNYNILSFKFAPGLLPRLLKGKYDAIIWGNASGKTKDLVVQLIEAYLCFLVSRIKRKPFIMWYGGWGWREHHWQKNTLANIIKRMITPPVWKLLLTHADAIITYGTKPKDFYISLNIEPGKIFIAYNTSLIDYPGADEQQITSLKESLEAKGKKIILYVGRLVERKNVDILVNAFAELRKEQEDIYLLIIGDGECRYELEQLCQNTSDMLITTHLESPLPKIDI